MEVVGIYVAVFVVFGLLTGSLAARKNRNGLVWDIFGGVSPILVLLVLMFLPFLCPKCKGALSNREFRNGLCPHCQPAA